MSGIRRGRDLTCMQHENLPRLFINHIPSLDWLIALEFGRVDEGQPEDHWVSVSEDFGFLCDAPQRRPVGFKILRFSQFDLDDPDVSAIWETPLFTAPTLGLARASAGEVATVARATFGPEPTVNREYFNEALEAESEAEEIVNWRVCLETGDCMAHYGLGIALLEADQASEAYDHLRFYAQISPENPWAHHWHGRAAMALGELGEARAALGRSLEFESEAELMNRSRMLLVRLERAG